MQSCCIGCHTQNRPENEADARCPSKGKNYADQHRCWIARTARMEFNALLPVKDRPSEKTCQMQTEEYKQNASNLTQQSLVGAQKAAQSTRCSTKRNESKCKAQDKHQSMQKSSQVGRM